jgi:hypothetical protein
LSGDGGRNLRLREIKYIGHHGHQNALTLMLIVIRATGLGVKCYRI